MDLIESDDTLVTEFNASGEFGHLTIMPEEDESATSSVPVAHCLSSSTNHYHQEWQKYFGPDFNVDKLRELGVQGQLRSCRFRSICWRVYLNCLSKNPSEWVSIIQESRKNYGKLKKSLITNPRTDEGDQSKSNPKFNNPLSQEEKSDWNKYFKDEDLRMTIQQDVTRTFPEIEFFHSEEVQEMMVNILFCYAKSNKNLCYKQGMHEIIAPILFVLFYDHQSYLHASELKLLDSFEPTLRNDISIVLDPQQAESDAFHMFKKLIAMMEPWFASPKDSHSPCKSSAKDLVHQTPFKDTSDNNSGSCIGKRLCEISKLLKHHDPQLYAHLEQMEITPQLYGIRWLRLLFGREFAMQDILVVWDALLATSLELVDYIFTAMLLFIRQQLLSGDYMTCLEYLMRYPAITDVHSILQLALYLKDPSVNTGDSSISEDLLKMLQRPLSPNSLSPTAPKRKVSGGGNSKAWLPSAIKNLANVPKTLPLNNPTRASFDGASGKKRYHRKSFEEHNYHKSCEETSHRKSLQERTPIDDQLVDSMLHHKTFSASLGIQPLTFQEPARIVDEWSRSKEMVSIKSYTKATSPRKAKQQQRETEMEAKVKYCSCKLSTLIDSLQGKLIDESLKNEDEIFLALAGLKHVRDVLKGEVSYREEVELNPAPSLPPSKDPALEEYEVLQVTSPSPSHSPLTQ